MIPMRGNRRYDRPSSDFDRVGYFSDAVFAIAMTLLVVGIGVPRLANPAELGDELRTLRPEILSFFISFFVIGSYWRAHHDFMSRLKTVDRRFLTLNLFYLAAIAFVPFPTGLIGAYEEQPEAFVLYAVTLAVASGFDVLNLWYCRQADLLIVPVSPQRYRGVVVEQLIPVIVFLGSIPIALYWDTTPALLSWISIALWEPLVDRFVPAEEAAAGG
jgi:uncharacterized membrane protein